MGSVYHAIGPKAHPAMKMESSRRAVERREVRVGVSLIRNGTGCGGNMLGVVVVEVAMAVGVIGVRGCRRRARLL